MARQFSEQRPERPWSLDYLIGVGWGSVPLVLFLGALYLWYRGGTLGLSPADGLAVLALLAYVGAVIVYYLIRKRKALALRLATMLILELILIGLSLTYEPLLVRHM